MTKKSLVLINQNEEGVIATNDPNHDGLITFGLESCVAVVIADKNNGTYALQHIGVDIDLPSITDRISRFPNQSDLTIHLAINKADKERDSTKSNLTRIKDHLKENGITVPGIYNVDSGGICIMKDGKIRDYTISPSSGADLEAINHSGDYKYPCEYYGKPSEFIVEKNLALANTRLFKEKTPLHIRYDNGAINEDFQDLPQTTIDALKLASEDIKNYLDEIADGIEGADTEEEYFSARNNSIKEILISKVPETNIDAINEADCDHLMNHIVNMMTSDDLKQFLGLESPRSSISDPEARSVTTTPRSQSPEHG